MGEITQRRWRKREKNIFKNLGGEVVSERGIKPQNWVREGRERLKKKDVTLN